MNKSIIVYKDGSYSIVDSNSVWEYQNDENWLNTIPLPKYSNPAVYSPKYLEWVEQAGLPPLTNTQHRFAEWLLLEDNAKFVGQVGDLNEIFISIRSFIKK